MLWLIDCDNGLQSEDYDHDIDAAVIGRENPMRWMPAFRKYVSTTNTANFQVWKNCSDPRVQAKGYVRVPFTTKAFVTWLCKHHSYRRCKFTKVVMP
jgi:hypothetical protein